MSRVPKNVKQMLDTSRALEAAQAYAKSIQKGRIVADWHTTDYERMSRRDAGLTAIRSTGSNPLVASTIVPGGIKEARETGILTGIEVAKAARRARLRELLEREALAYEQELHAMGLSLVKPRD